ncbi:MAG: hypothetical protein ACOYB5_03540 [Patescibacteria group bacterium]|jgi:hypothetical protein|nr:hypothetical protein [Candidatus Moranbacteria bacterium]HOF42548.1 hypothetical protein [Candidatus Moranbacteria bacterium]
MQIINVARANRAVAVLAIILLSLFGFTKTIFAASDDKIIFLHHSTGGAVYSTGTVASRIATYNSQNGTNLQITHREYPNTPYPWNNYAYDYWNLWVNGACNSTQAGIECMNTLAQNYDVIIWKHCYPGAAVLADTGSPSISSNRKSLENYKLQYRALRDMMDSYPNNKFIVWTLVPLHRLATNPSDAARARQFVDWVKEQWLSEDGNSHPNIYIFDFYGLVAGADNFLKYEYEGSHTSSDSHPNTLANQTVGPIFSQFIANTALAQISSDETAPVSPSGLAVN